MKRHISIFAFLLSAFAAVSQASAEQTVYAHGWWLPDDSEFKYIGDQSEKLITPESYGGLGPSESVTFKATPKTGWTVDHWRLGREYVSDDNQGEKISGTEGQIEYVWRYNAAVYDPVLAVKFRWLTYDLECKSDGQVVFSKVNADYREQFQIGGTVSPTVGKTFLGQWKDLNGNVYAQGANVQGSSFQELADVHTDIPSRHVVTLTAQWATNTYSVAYALAGGNWPAGAAHPESVEYFKTFAVTDPVKDGFTFTGWKLSTTGEIKSGLGGKTEFENLVAENGGSVTLTAQWSAKSYTVTLLHPGSYSAADSITVTFGETPGDLTPPRYSGGDLFGGYFTEQDGKGLEYWDEDGNWIGPDGTGGPWRGLADITLHAYVIVNNWRTVRFFPNGGSLNETTKDYYVGRKFSDTALLPIPIWEGDRYVFGGWKVAGTGELITNDSIVPAGAGDLTLEAEKSPNSYFISFEPNGATEGRMEVQEFKFDAQAPLATNEYEKTGYRFKGWSKSAGIAAGLPIDYGDGQEVCNLATTGLETNSLYAVWETNRYWVAFEPNGGTGTSITNLYLYDQPQNLPPSDLFAPPSGFWRFSCWSNTVSGLVWTNECESVTNLTAANDATVVIKAVWKTSLSDLALAMDCDSLNWTNVARTKDTSQSGAKWSVAEPGYESESCVMGPTFSTTPYSQCLTSSCITNNGTLTFWWKPKIGEGKLALWIDNKESFSNIGDVAPSVMKGSEGTWTLFSTNLTVEAGSCLYVHLFNRSNDSQCYIDQMTWTTGGPKPVDGEDNVDISSAGISADGKSFSLSFTSKAEFDYNLLTNANLLIDSWGVMTNEVGTGEPITFKPEIIEGQPQLFYKVETIQRK